MPVANRIFVFLFSLLLMAGVAAFAYAQEIQYLLWPLGLMALVFFLQFPEYLLYALLATIPWSIGFNLTPELGLNVPDEPLMLLTALAALLLFIHQRKKRMLLAHPLVLLLGLQLVWTVVTVVSSTDVLLSTKYFLAKSWYLAAFVLAPLFLFDDPKQIRRAVTVLLLSMMAFMFFALFRHAQFNWTFENINDALVPYFVNHVDYSALLVFMVPVQLAIMQLSSSHMLKMVMRVLLLITLAALYLSYARGAWLALVAGLAAYWFLKKRWLLGGFLLFIAFCLAGILWLKSNDRYLNYTNDYRTTIFHTDFREHLVATYKFKDVSTAERFHRWVAGVRMIEDSWKTGLGPSSFYKQYKSYTVPEFKTWVSRNEEQSTVHNYFLLMIIEQGVFGLLFFVVLVALMFAYAQKIYHRTGQQFWKVAVAAAASILAMQCVINSLSDMIETDKVGSVFYLCVAVLVVADFKTKKASDPATHI